MSDWQVSGNRPLAGIRVLDLTRVLAGPVATRFLAGFGAEVLRIDPPEWDEPGVIPEVTLGKRCARLDLRRPDDRRAFEDLLASADVLVHGYRPGALKGLGLDEAARQKLRPGLVDVSLDAYGWSGPWRERRGFDSLVQMSSGIAAEGMRRFGADKPRPLPVQALDHATGYIMAAGVVRGLVRRLTKGVGSRTRTSLARTAALLTNALAVDRTRPFEEANDADFETATEATGWGLARRMKPPLDVDGAGMRWDHPANPLGSSEPGWTTR
jgi:crotonobetainyl-CoA:carnitine CoA-transferase CaiB-like acyl-CoA transferase